MTIGLSDAGEVRLVRGVSVRRPKAVLLHRQAHNADNRLLKRDFSRTGDEVRIYQLYRIGKVTECDLPKVSQQQTGGGVRSMVPSLPLDSSSG